MRINYDFHINHNNPMHTLNIFDSLPSAGCRAREFSLFEMLAVVGAMAAMTGMGVVAVQDLRESAERSQLQRDVGRLNNAVQTYLMNGGTIPADADPAAVLARLKTKATTATATTVVGLSGPFIDERIAGVGSGTGVGPVRATWNATTKRFQLTTSGPGYISFHLGGAVGTSPATETRSTGQKFASRDPWVWDYESEETVVVVAKPEDVMTSLPEDIGQTPQGQPRPRRLVPSEFSRPSDSYHRAEAWNDSSTATNPVF